jgi:hypothetical protein
MPRADSADAAGCVFVAGPPWRRRSRQGRSGCQGNPMDQRIESFLADVFRARGRRTGRGPRGGARRPGGLRGDLPGAGDEQAHEGPSRSRQPRAVPCSRRRGNISTPRNADRRALDAGALDHRPAGAFNLTAAASRRPGPSRRPDACFIVRDANSQYESIASPPPPPLLFRSLSLPAPKFARRQRRRGGRW